MADALTPEIARDLMYRSMTTGAPTSEFNRYGGYDAVASMYTQGGGGYSLSEIPAAQKTALAQQIANSGVGNLSLLAETNTPLTARGREAMVNNGVTSFDAAMLRERGIPFEMTTGERLDDLSGRYSTLNSQYGTLNTNYTNLQNQLNALQASYAALQRRGTGNTGSSGTSGGTGVVGDSGATVDDGSTSGGGTGMDTTMGAVYGPDGTMYSSPAAARAAGVFNYTRVRPVRTTNPATTQTPNPTVNASPIGFGGGLINNVVQGDPMTYFTDNARVGLPAGVRAAF